LRKKDDDYGFSDDNESEEAAEYLNLPRDTTRWMVDEWGYHDYESKRSEMTGIGRLLFKEGSAQMSNEHYWQWRDTFIVTVTDAFREVIDSGVLNLDPDVVYLVTETDGDDEMAKCSAWLLNTEKVYDEFCKSYNSMS
jgi:hypothetical protein